MLGWLNLIAALALALFAIWFSQANPGDVVINLPAGLVLDRVPLFGLLSISIMMGFLFGLLSSWAGAARVRRRLARLQRQNLALEEELTNLRNQPFDNDLHL